MNETRSVSFDPDNFEEPVCIFTGRKDYEDYPWGTIHLNLAPPIRVVRCIETGMLYLCPRPNRINRELLLQGIIPEALRDYGENIYDYASIDKLRTSDFEERMRIFDHEISKNNDRSVLDVGCCSGSFLEIANRAGWKAVGIEPYLKDVNICQSKGLDVIQGMAERLPFPDDSFFVVHSSHVFEHLEDPLSAAREAYRVLKPGGLLFIEVPNQLDNFGFHRDVVFRSVRKRKRDVSSIHHLWFFGRRTLHLLYEQAGYEEIRVENKYPKPFGGWRYPFSLASQMLSRIICGSYIIRGLGYKPIIGSERR